MGIPYLVLTLAVLSSVQITSAQVGLRTAPLTAPRIRHHNDNNKNNKTGMELFAKWPNMEVGHRRGKMESELAAIFRGVAYGMSTLPSTTVIQTSTTTTTTSTTTDSPDVNNSKDDQQNPSQRHKHQKTQSDNHSEQKHNPLIPPSYPDWRESEFPQSEAHPIPTKEPAHQYPYVESPEVTSISTSSDDVIEPTKGVTDIQVVRADVTEVEWIRALGVSWFVHVYTAAGLYSILALLALFCIIRVKADMYLLPTGYYITLHILMFVASILRCIHLFHDPYGAEQRLPQPLSQTVEETAWPCLTAALAVVVMAIVRAWQCPRLIPQHNYGPLGLALLTSVHLLMTLTALLTAYLIPDQASALNAASRAVTLAWGSTVGLCGLFITWKVGKDSRRYSHSSQLSLRFGINHLQTSTSIRNPRAILVHGTNLAIASCLTQISLAALHLYALVGPHYILDIPPVYPWCWMAYHSTARAFEITTWILLCATSVLNLGVIPNKRSDSSGETKLLTVLGCQCCGSSTSIATEDNTDDIHPSTYQTNRSVRNFTLLNCGKGGFQETLADPLMDNGKPVIRIEQNISLKNSPPFQETGSNVHLLWNNSNTPNTNQVPPSMLFNESGFVRFKMNVDPSQAVDEVIRKSLQNLDLVSQIHDSKYPNKQLSQKQLNATEYSDDPPPYEKTAASPHLTRKPSIGSPQPRSGGNLEQLLNNQINTKLYTGHGTALDNHNGVSTTDISSPEPSSPQLTSDADWSKYDSTCSSISAANSFDVRMYNDIEVSQYYQNPSYASYHMYTSLHRPPNLGHQSQQNTSYRFPNDMAFNNHEPNQSTSQIKALLSPKNVVKSKFSPTSISSVESDQEMDVRLNNIRYTPQFKKSVSVSPCPKRSTHRSLRHNTPDSGLAMDFSGNTDETSGDEFFRPIGHHPRRRQQSFTTTGHHQSPTMMHVEINNRQQQSPLISPTRPPLHPGSPILQEKQRLHLQHQLQKRIQNEQLKQQNQQRQIEELIRQRKLEQSETLLIKNDPSWPSCTSSSRENVNISGSARHHELQPQASPLLYRLASYNASNSDLTSECVDSEDEVKRDQNTSVESAYENVLEPITAEAWPPPARIIRQAEV